MEILSGWIERAEVSVDSNGSSSISLLPRKREGGSHQVSCMPRCTNCGGEVESSHNYCGSCGDQLDVVVRFEPGMLSSDSKEYLMRRMRSNGDVNQESMEFERVLEEVGRAIGDFSYLGPIPSFSINTFIDNEAIDALVEATEDDIENEELIGYVDLIFTMIGLLNLKKLVADQIPEGSEVEKIEGFRNPPIDIYELLAKHDE